MNKFLNKRILLVFLLTFGCSDKHPDSPLSNRNETIFDVDVLKWYGGHSAAVSITYDTLWGHWKTQDELDYIVDEILKRNLRIDFELCTVKYDKPEYQFIVTDMRDNVIPDGVHFFGHGHNHDAHDNFDFEYCYESFKKCYDLMDEWGLEPKAYAYPYGSGWKESTQSANKMAGFICARGVTIESDSIYMSG